MIRPMHYLDRTDHAYSEVAPLRAVLLHRPGRELARLTPRNNQQLLFDAVPWVERAQTEHDGFTRVLRERGVEVLLVGELLAETLAIPQAREMAVISALANPRLGVSLHDDLAAYLADLGPESLAETLIAGLTKGELATGSGLVYKAIDDADFIIDPLPNVMFTRDSSIWFGKHVAITTLATAARRRESDLTALIYTYHPRFQGIEKIYGSQLEALEGGDVLHIAPGVVAIGMGGRTGPAGAERLARGILGDGHAHTVLAVPISRARASIHLDTLVTMVDVATILVYPNVVDDLTAFTLTSDEDGRMVVQEESPFLVAAAKAMNVDELRLIDADLDPMVAEREQWNDAHNTLAISPGVVVAYERNWHTNERLAKAGVEVVEIAGSEMGSGRGGPRCLTCAVRRSTALDEREMNVGDDGERRRTSP